MALNIWAASWQNQQSDCAPSEDSDQPGHPPSLIRIFAVRTKKAWVLSYPLSAQRRLWSDWAEARLGGCTGWSESSLAHSHFVGFVTRRLIFLWRVNILLTFKSCYVIRAYTNHFKTLNCHSSLMCNFINAFTTEKYFLDTQNSS